MQPAEPARSGTGFSAPESPARLKETEENPPRASLELEFREVRNKIREVRNRTHALIENAHSR